MLDITKKITADLDAVRSRVEELADDFRLAWESADDYPVRSALLEESKYNCEDAAELIERAFDRLEVILTDHGKRS